MMSKSGVWKILVGAFLVVLLLGINIKQNLRLKAFVEPNSHAEVNWITESGLWFGGTYVDNDGDGVVIVDLPVDITLITIGREMKNGPNVAIISAQEGHTLEEDAGSRCPVIVANDRTPLLNLCQLSTLNIDEMTGSGKIEIVRGASDIFGEFISKDFSTLLNNSSSTRSVSIELLDNSLLETLPVYTGSGQILGSDSLNMRWGFASG